MDPTTNTDNTNVTPPTDGVVNDLGASAMPPADLSVPAAPAAMPEAVEPSADDTTNVVESTDSVPTEPIIGMSAPISDDTAVESAPIDLPAVSDAPATDTAVAPENIPVEPAPTDTSSTPDSNQNLGSF